ncbi:hypothetical protein AAMO2058_000283100 [Amorphochlora amoebiformis]
MPRKKRRQESPLDDPVELMRRVDRRIEDDNEESEEDEEGLERPPDNPPNQALEVVSESVTLKRSGSVGSPSILSPPPGEARRDIEGDTMSVHSLFSDKLLDRGLGRGRSLSRTSDTSGYKKSSLSGSSGGSVRRRRNSASGDSSRTAQSYKGSKSSSTRVDRGYLDDIDDIKSPNIMSPGLEDNLAPIQRATDANKLRAEWSRRFEQRQRDFQTLLTRAQEDTKQKLSPAQRLAIEASESIEKKRRVIEVRKSWIQGSKLEIFSQSLDRWIPGIIKSISIEDGEEWLEVLYHHRKKRKQVQRFDTATTRPLQSDLAVSAFQPHGAAREDKDELKKDEPIAKVPDDIMLKDIENEEEKVAYEMATFANRDNIIQLSNAAGEEKNTFGVRFREVSEDVTMGRLRPIPKHPERRTFEEGYNDDAAEPILDSSMLTNVDLQIGDLHYRLQLAQESGQYDLVDRINMEISRLEMEKHRSEAETRAKSEAEKLNRNSEILSASTPPPQTGGFIIPPRSQNIPKKSVNSDILGQNSAGHVAPIPGLGHVSGVVGGNVRSTPGSGRQSVEKGLYNSPASVTTQAEDSAVFKSALIPLPEPTPLPQDRPGVFGRVVGWLTSGWTRSKQESAPIPPIPTSHLATRAIREHIRHGDYGFAVKDEIANKLEISNQPIYSEVLEAYIADDKLEAAIELLTEMRAKGIPVAVSESLRSSLNKRPQPQSGYPDTLRRIFIKGFSWREALGILYNLKGEKKINVGPSAFGAAIRLCSEQESLAGALQVFTLMQGSRINPTPDILHEMAGLCLRSGSRDDAKYFVKAILQRGSRLDCLYLLESFSNPLREESGTSHVDLAQMFLMGRG